MCMVALFELADARQKADKNQAAENPPQKNAVAQHA
jgi:hypothetical protein